MSQPLVGVGSFVGVGEQNTNYDTPVVAQRYVPMISGGDSIKRTDAQIESSSIEEAGMLSTRYRKGKRDVSGNITLEVMNEGTELFWKHIFGAVADTQPNSGGAPTVYDHTFTISDTLPNPLTLEINRGGTSFRVTGAMINSCEISQGIDKFLEMNMNINGKDLDIITASTPSFTTTQGFASPDAVLTWNGVQQDCSGFKLNLNQNIDGARYFIGAKTKQLPVRNGLLDFSGSFDTEFQSSTIFTDFINATQRQLVITSTGDAIGATGYNYTWRLVLPIVLLLDATPTVNDGGKITYSPSFKVFRTPSANEASLLIRNTLATF